MEAKTESEKIVEMEQGMRILETEMEDVRNKMNGLEEAQAKTQNSIENLDRKFDLLMEMIVKDKGKPTSPTTSVSSSPTNQPQPDSLEQAPTTPTVRRSIAYDDANFSLIAKAKEFKVAPLTPMNLGIETQRRLSSFELVLNTVDTPAPASAFNVNAQHSPSATTVFIQSEDFRSIVWSKDRLDSFLNFLEEVHQYDIEHDKKIPSLYARMSVPMKMKIAQVLHRIDSSKFHEPAHYLRATRADIISAVQYHYLPRDRNDFLSKLSMACKPYRVEVVDYDFRLCATKLNVLRAKFIERFLFLKQACERGNPSAIPSPGFKEGCSFNAFLELTPMGSRQEFRTLLYDKGKELSDFLEGYFALVDSTLEKSMGLVLMCKRLGLEVPVAPPTQQQSKGSNFLNNGKFLRRKGDSREVLALMDEFESYDSDGEGADNVVSDEEEVQSREDEDLGQAGLNALHSNSVNSYKGSRAMHSTQTEKRQDAMPTRSLRPATSNSTSTTSLKPQIPAKSVTRDQSKKSICRFFEEFGTCNKGKDCKFSHDEKDLDAYRKSVAARYYKRMKGDKKPTALLMEGDDSEDDSGSESDYLEPGRGAHINLITELLRVTRDSSKWIAAHKAAKVKCGAREFAVNAALFDSGANLDNYVSMDFVEEHGLEHMLQRVDTRVQVADGKIRKIQHSITMQVEFLDSMSKPHSAYVKFMVFQGLTKGIVLGFRTIVIEFSELFKEMIDEAKLWFTSADIDYSGSYSSGDDAHDMNTISDIGVNFFEGASTVVETCV